MSTIVTTVPAADPDTVPPNFRFADLLVTGPQSVAFLSVLLLTASAHSDFPLGGKATLLEYPYSFKTSAQQIVNETHNAYLENDKAFNGLRLLLGQIPQSIDQFFAILNEGGPDELKFLGQNTLNSVSKLIASSVIISEQAETNFDNLLALVQELLVAVLSTAGGQALQHAEQRELDVSIARAGADAIQKNINASSKALSDFQAQYAKAVERFRQASSHLPNGPEAQAVGAALVEDLASSLASAAERFISHNTRTLDDAKVSIAIAEARLAEHIVPSLADSAKAAFEEAEKRFEEASKSILPEWALSGEAIVQPLVASGAATAQSTSMSAEALRAAKASLAAAQKQFEDAVKNLPNGWDRVGAEIAQHAEEGILSGSGMVSDALAAVKEQATALLRRTQDSLAEAQRQFDAAVKDLPAGWDVIAHSVVDALAAPAAATSAGASAPPLQPTARSAEALRAAKAALETVQKTFQDAMKQIPIGWEEVGHSVIKSLGSERFPKTEVPPSDLRGPVPKIVQLLRKVIDSYRRHIAQIKQITQLLRSAQAITDNAAPKAIEGLRATLSSGDKTTTQDSKDGVVTLGSLQRDIAVQQAKNVLDIVNAITHISAIYAQVSNDYTLPGQRKLGEMIQFPTTISPQDDKGFLARLDEKEAEVLKANDETTKKILQLMQPSSMTELWW